MPFPHRPVVLVALALCGLAGCVTNPYIRPARPELPANASASEKLRLAIDYADRVYEDYAAMPSKEFERQRSLSNGLLVTAAAALGMAAGQVHSDALLGTALIGGTAYQIGNWNHSPTRLRIFIEARKSLACGREAVAPLDMSDAELDGVRTQVKATMGAARSAAQAAGDVTRWLAEVSRSGSAVPLVATAEAELARFGERFESAKRVVSHAAGTERLVGSAGGLLVAHVGKVRTLVDAALDDTQASLTTLPTAIADLGRSAAIIAPSLDLESTFGKKLTAPPSGPKVNAESACIDEQGRKIACRDTAIDPVGGLTEALGRLRARTADLEIETETLGALDPMALEKLRAAIVSCNPDLAQALKPLVARPETLEFVAGVPDAAVVAISGGTLPYASALQGASIPGLSTQLSPDRLVAKVGADTVAGDTQSVVFSDATGALVTVRIRIKAKTTVAPADGAATSPAGDANANARARAAAEARKAQAAARKKVGTAPPVAVPAAPGTAGATADTPLVADAPLLPARQCEVEGARTDFECSLSMPQMRGIRTRLGLARTPERFDAEVRAKLAALQSKQSMPASGNYDLATAQVVDALSGQ